MVISRAAVIGAIFLLAANGSAQQPASTVQQQFDAAVKLDEGTDPAASLAAWQALAVRTARNPRSHAIMLIRESAALSRLHREDDAVTMAREGLAGLPDTDRTLDGDRYNALMTIAFADHRVIDYAGAADAYTRALTYASDASEKLSANLGIAQVALFVDQAQAEAALGRLDAIVAASKVAPDVVALIEQQRALTLLSRGEARAAVVPARAAVKSLGGLTERTSIRDVSARSTAAVAMLLSGDKDEARHYMAMTGAGRLNSGSFDPAVQMRVPDCGGPANLKPADMAVIEFSIADDGTVGLVTPIYAAGGGAVALEFARAVRDWSWTPEQVKALPPFFRHSARIEMRCSTGFERLSLDRLLAADLERWLEEHGAPLPDQADGRAAAAVTGERAALARFQAADPNSLQTLSALWTLSGNAVVGREETHELTRRALAIAVAKGAPPTARLAIDLAYRSTEQSSRRGRERALRALTTDTFYAADPAARAAARLSLAEVLGRGNDEQRALLRQVAVDASLPKDDRFRVGALVRLASLEQQAGNAEAARAAFDQTGLAANQCAIVDAPPRLLNVGGSFPQEAMTWGFEGWTQTQFDITADGRVVNERAILSYPPFVFTNAGTRTIAGARYAKSFRPAGELGCGASTQRVRFLMGH